MSKDGKSKAGPACPMNSLQSRFVSRSLALIAVWFSCLVPTYAGEDLISDSTITYGQRDVARAWLAEPTERYPHGVLGDNVEAGALVVETRSGKRIVHRLSESFVFEDLSPLISDLDLDGRDEVIVVRSDMELGASLVVYGIMDGALVAKTETAPIGAPYRWLNPVGAADLDGDGEMEVALVETPHIGGVLKIFSVRAGDLVLRDSMSGLTNHVIGSTALDLHVLVDWDGNGLQDIVIPSQSREALVVIAFTAGKLLELDRMVLPGPVNGNITISGELLHVPTSKGVIPVSVGF